MSGSKLFSNFSNYDLNVTLVVRGGDDPRNPGGSVDFELPPGQSAWQTYGNDSNVYLNGIKLVAYLVGSLFAEQQIVVTRGSPLDDELNMRNAVDFSWENGTFVVSTRQV